jgi:uncharacterized membrane protein
LIVLIRIAIAYFLWKELQEIEEEEEEEEVKNK